MRDPDLVHRAEVAAAELERAWYCWRSTCSTVVDPMPTMSSYVGYSLEEPWGQPRVVFGIAAEDAEELAVLLVRPELAGPARAGLVTSAEDGDGDGDEPVFRQVTAARRHAVEGPGEPSDQPASEHSVVTRPDAGSPDAMLADADADDAGGAGPWTLAATAARVETEARIRANLRDAMAQRSEAAERPADVDDDADTDQYASDRQDVATGAPARRGRMTRGYAIAKLSRAKRPGTVPGL